MGKFSLLFWKRLAEDALSGAASAALAVLGVDAVNIGQVDWSTVGGVAAGAAVVMILKGLAGGSNSDPYTTYVTKP
jgi:hypothetical protein